MLSPCDNEVAATSVTLRRPNRRVQRKSKKIAPSVSGRRVRERDELYEPAIEIILREGRGSVALLQRALGIGYGRAARLIDFMAEDGIVGSYNGSNAREVLYTPEQWAALRGAATEESG